MHRSHFFVLAKTNDLDLISCFPWNDFGRFRLEVPNTTIKCLDIQQELQSVINFTCLFKFDAKSTDWHQVHHIAETIGCLHASRASHSSKKCVGVWSVSPHRILVN